EPTSVLPLPPASPHSRIEQVRLQRRPEGARRRRPAFPVGDWIEEIALWDVIAVDPTPAAIVPRPCRDVLQGVDRVRRAAEAVERLPEQVFVHAHLHRALPVAGEV